MAHTSDINYILDRITQEDIRNYSILDGDKKTVIEESQDNSLTSDMVRTRVNRTLNALSGGGIVWISLSSKSKLEKAAGGNVGTNKMIAFNTGGQVSGIGNTGSDTASSIGAITAALEEKFNAKLEAMQLQNKHDAAIRDLQNKLEEAQNSSPIVKMIEPILPQIITGLFGQMPRPIAGPPKEETTAVQVEEISDEEQAAIENALSRLISLDPDFPALLQKIATLAETNRPLYDQAKNFLTL